MNSKSLNDEREKGSQTFGSIIIGFFYSDNFRLSIDKSIH